MTTEPSGIREKIHEIIFEADTPEGKAFDIALLISMLAAFLAGLAGGILCGIGALFTTFYAQLVNAFLFGNLYNQAKQAVV